MDYIAFYLELYTYLVGSFEVSIFKTRKQPNSLAKHAIRKHLHKECGIKLVEICSIEEALCGIIPDHSTIISSCKQNSYFDIRLKNYTDTQIIHHNKTADVDKLITYIFNKGEGYNRAMLIENINKYYKVRKL